MVSRWNVQGIEFQGGQGDIVEIPNSQPDSAHEPQSPDGEDPDAVALGGTQPETGVIPPGGGGTGTNVSNRGGKICPFYKNGKCKYGAAGRGCKDDHPRPCKKLLQHGTKAPNGCTLGRDRCDKFYPKMSPVCILKSECFNTNYRLKHINGTKRSKNDKTSVKMGSTNKPLGSRGQQNDHQSGPSDFLEMMRVLKLEILQAMDAKLAALSPVTTPPPRRHLQTSQQMLPAPVQPQVPTPVLGGYHMVTGGAVAGGTGHPVTWQLIPCP